MTIEKELPDRPYVGPTWGIRMAGIEGLRGLAAMSVLTGHVAILMKGDVVLPGLLTNVFALMLHGVTLFFILSGFLLYRPFAAAVIRGSSLPLTGAFYRNRVLRIWPVYLVILAVAGLVLGTTVVQAGDAGTSDLTVERIGYLTDPLLLLLNATLTQGFVPRGMLTGLNVSWSLAPEVCFYVLLPALGLAGARVARRGNRVAAAFSPCIGLLVVGGIGRISALVLTHAKGPDQVANLQTGGNWQDVVFRSIIGQGDLFAMGMAVAVIVVALEHVEVSHKRVRSVRRCAMALLVFGLLAIFALRAPDLIAPFVGLACASALALLMIPGSSLYRRTAIRALESLPLRGLGLCSYSIYLWHFPIIWFIRLHWNSSLYHSVGGLALRIVIVALSAITYRYVELPAMRRKSRTN